MHPTLTIKIIGLDPSRYPCISNKNYIDVSYMLSEEAPTLWLDIFNEIFKNDKTVRMDRDNRQRIETWVRNMEDIPNTFSLIKKAVALSNQKYHEKLVIDEKSKKDSFSHKENSQSNRLDLILSLLEFD